jgi:hypothetical protein
VIDTETFEVNLSSLRRAVCPTGLNQVSRGMRNISSLFFSVKMSSEVKFAGIRGLHASNEVQVEMKITLGNSKNTAKFSTYGGKLM